NREHIGPPGFTKLFAISIRAGLLQQMANGPGDGDIATTDKSLSPFNDAENPSNIFRLRRFLTQIKLHVSPPLSAFRS
ncbi:hypothetical protein, partial [Salmonella sp. SAL4360]|uniref:hypothetical protein n=1 Tax=Salmonella sp. SAL4360 TaxID=3159881 RepID=UPI00397CF35D